MTVDGEKSVDESWEDTRESSTPIGLGPAPATSYEAPEHHLVLLDPSSGALAHGWIRIRFVRIPQCSGRPNVSPLLAILYSVMSNCVASAKGSAEKASLTAQGVYAGMPLTVQLLWNPAVLATSAIELELVSDSGDLWMYFGSCPRRGLPRWTLRDPRLGDFALGGAPAHCLPYLMDESVEARLGAIAEGSSSHAERMLIHADQVSIEIAGWPADRDSLVLLVDLIVELEARARRVMQLASTASPPRLPGSAASDPHVVQGDLVHEETPRPKSEFARILPYAAAATLASLLLGLMAILATRG